MCGLNISLMAVSLYGGRLSLCEFYNSFCSIILSCILLFCCFFFFFQAEDGIRDAQESRGLGDVYKRQVRNGLNNEVFSSRYSSLDPCNPTSWIPVGVIIVSTKSIESSRALVKIRFHSKPLR